MSWVAVGVGAVAVVGAGVQYMGAQNQANAIGAASNAQLSQQEADRSLALQYANNPAYLNQLQQSVDLNNQDIARRNAILEATDPAVIEAGKQAQLLLKGQSSAALKPIQDQRAQQRATLVESLQRQLGPGYATSSSGIAALNQFDTQTSDMLAGAQQNTLASFLGVSQAQSMTGLTPDISASNQIAGLYGQQAGEAISAINGTPINAGQAYAGQIASNNATMGLGQNLTQTASTLGSLYGGRYPAGNTNSGGLGSSDGAINQDSFSAYGNNALGTYTY